MIFGKEIEGGGKVDGLKRNKVGLDRVLYEFHIFQIFMTRFTFFSSNILLYLNKTF